jgi:hypothetical protein
MLRRDLGDARAVCKLPTKEYRGNGCSGIRILEKDLRKLGILWYNKKIPII